MQPWPPPPGTISSHPPPQVLLSTALTLRDFVIISYHFMKSLPLSITGQQGLGTSNCSLSFRKSRGNLELGCSSVGDCLPSMYKALSSMPGTRKRKGLCLITANKSPRKTKRKENMCIAQKTRHASSTSLTIHNCTTSGYSLYDAIKQKKHIIYYLNQDAFKMERSSHNCIKPANRFRVHRKKIP